MKGDSQATTFNVVNAKDPLGCSFIHPLFQVHVSSKSTNPLPPNNISSDSYLKCLDYVAN